jgi:hypothetical protein
MTQQAKVWALRVYADHAIYNDDGDETRHPPTEGVVFSSLAAVGRAADRYKEFLKRTEDITVKNHVEDMGMGGRVQSFTLDYGDGTSRMQIAATTNFGDGRHDYILSESLGFLTGKFRELPMVVERVNVRRAEGDCEQWLLNEIHRLNEVFASLETISSDLRIWAEGGHSMLLRCFTGCNGFVPAIIGPERLAEFLESGMSLQDVKARLVCRKCKKREFFIVPA